MGVKRVYEGYGADIEAPPGTAHEAMERFARRLFDTRLRAMNESAGGDLVWITFYLGGGQRPDGTVLRQTYRVIYVREGGQWRTPSARGSGRA